MVGAEMRAVTLVLDAERAQQHDYDGKFVVCESMATLLADCGALVMVEDGALLATLEAAAEKKVVSLSFDGWQKCVFVAKEEERVETPVRMESEILGARISEVVTVTCYRWRFEAAVEMTVMVGTEKLVLWRRDNSCEILTAENAAPRETALIGPFTAEASFLFRGKPFVFDSEDVRCRTPRRNPQMDELLARCNDVIRWSAQVAAVVAQLRQAPFETEEMERPESWQLPIVPLLKSDIVDGVVARFKSMWSNSGSHQQREFESATVLSEMAAQFFVSVAKVETMMHDQLTSAIGVSRVTRDDLEQHMRLRMQSAYGESVVRPMCRSVRCDGESDPEAIVVIGERGSADGWLTMSSGPDWQCGEVTFPISAATVVRCLPAIHVHGVTLFDVKGEPSHEAAMTVTTRQFGMCVIVLGRLEQNNRLVPEHAVLVQSRQILEIPLGLEVLPSQREFREAVASMSTEQRDFAQAFRAMQLSSTAFAVLVLHVKPQLERLLNVPRPVMTRELALARSVMELLLEYNIPPSLLRASETGTSEELSQNVALMLRMIAEMKAALIGSHPSRHVVEPPRVGGPLLWYAVYPKPLTPFVPSIDHLPLDAAQRRKKFTPWRRLDQPSAPLDAHSRAEQRRLAMTIRMIVFGLPQCGKTTLLKQVNIIYGNGFSAEEMEEFRQVCVHNALSCVSDYVVEHAQRILEEGFVPNNDDVMHCCARSSGVHDVEAMFDNSLLFRVSEVAELPAGRGRKKVWCQFEDCTCMLYVADTRNYDKLLEAVADFEEMINSKWLQSTNVVLLLNVGEVKKSETLRNVCPEFEGHDYNDELEYIRQLFKKKNRRTGREIYSHIVCAVDSDSIRVTFNAIKETLITRSMRSGGVGGVSSFDMPQRRAEPISRPIFAATAAPPLLVASKAAALPAEKVSRAETDAVAFVVAPVSDEKRVMADLSCELVRSCDATSMGQAMNNLLDRSGSSLRQTVLHVDSRWIREESGFLGATKRVELGRDEIAAERNTCFSLLDSLSNGGCLSLGNEAELHVIFATMHQYEKSIMETVVQDSRNPIEELEHDWSLMFEAICRPN